MVVILWLPTYAQVFFPTIKPQFGGGNHPKAILTLHLSDQTTAAQVAAIMGPIKMQNVTSEVIRVSLVAGEYVAIAPIKRSRAVLVSKSIVGAIRYQ
jgi:hypothetical protein